MPIPVASRSSDLATAEPSEWPTRIGDLHRCDEREYVPQNALVTDPNDVSLNAGGGVLTRRPSLRSVDGGCCARPVLPTIGL